MSRTVLISILVVGLGVSSLHAQSLADAAKKERERQAKVKTDPKAEMKVLTERDLNKTGGRTTSSRPTAAAPATSDRSSATGTAKAAETDGPKDLHGHDEAYWRQRKQALQEELDRADRRVKELDDFLGRHHADFTLQSLAPLKNERDETAKRADGIRQKMQDLEEEARKAGAPARWLR